MNANQTLKMELLKIFGNQIETTKSIDLCREAYAFLTEDTGNEKPAPGEVITNAPAAVDLGLPSGRLWADRNIGADAPEDCGLYFSWGNTEGIEFGKYCDFSEDAYKRTEGAELDGDLDGEHDAARVNLGEPWRMPSAEDFRELCDCTTQTMETVNGYRGMRFTSKKNGASVFFPCSGYGNGASWSNRGSLGSYWSSSFYSARYARNLYFNSGGVDPQDNNNRYIGRAVRPVQ